VKCARSQTFEVEEVAFFRLDELPPLIAEHERFLRNLPT
jgi:hypothetical protein